MMMLFLVIGSLCVWRFPDRDIKEIFDGDAYRTVFLRVSKESQAAIERRLGQKLDADETEFKFYPVSRKGKQIGVVSTHLSKGQYGAIEVVVALLVDSAGKAPRVKSVRIQRDREKARAALRSEKFLSQFVKKTSSDSLKVGVDLIPAAKGAEKSSQAVASAVRKLLVAYEELAGEGQ